MAYTTNQLISGAYYASGVVSREFETVSGGQVGDGLQWLNNILTEKNVDKGMIPYESTYTLNSVIGQEVYSIPNLIEIDTLVFYKDSVRFSMTYSPRNQYFGTDRVETIKSLPFQWYWERQFGGGNLYIYFTPDQAYPLELHGSFALSSVSLGQDLSLTFDEFYTTYLRYALADRICAEYNYSTPPNVIRQLGKYEAFINNISKTIDLRMTKQSSLRNRKGFGWSYVNLAKGWLPGV